jgi:hypothetical protein
MKINKKYFFNKFILIWVVFGLFIYFYSLFDILLNKKLFSEYYDIISLKYLLILIVLILYVIAYFRFNQKSKKENVAQPRI